MKYYSAKGKTLPIVMFILLVTLFPMINAGAWPGVIIFLVLEGLLIWIWFDTYYIIKDEQLLYKSAFIKGSIPISTIHEIVEHKGLYPGGLKPALSMKGLVIKYNRWDDMYVSPKKANEFIAELQKIKPDIKVSGA
jgi:hypothetical protein